MIWHTAQNKHNTLVQRYLASLILLSSVFFCPVQPHIQTNEVFTTAQCMFLSSKQSVVAAFDAFGSFRWHAMPVSECLLAIFLCAMASFFSTYLFCVYVELIIWAQLLMRWNRSDSRELLSSETKQRPNDN